MNRHDFDVELQVNGYSPAVEVIRPAGFRLDLHSHPFDAWALVINGEITIAPAAEEMQTVSAKTYKAGDMFQLSRGTLHHEFTGSDGATYLSGRREGHA